MPNFLENLGMETASSGIGTAMGLMLEKHNDARQLRQNQALMNQQIAGNEQVSQFNFNKQYEMWEKTNYPAQMEQLEKAGLNPGLLYGMGGAGGATTGGGGQGVSGGTAPSGGGEIMGLMMQNLQAQMMQAQTENIKANTNKTNAEIPNVSKTGQNIDASTAQLIQQAKTGAAQEQLSEAITKGQNIQNEISSATKENAISSIQANMQQQWQLFDKLVRENAIGNETYKDLVKTIQEQAISAYLNNKEIKQRIAESGSRITLNEASIKKMAADIMLHQKDITLGYDKLYEESRNYRSNEQNAATNAQAQQWHQEYGMPMDIAQDILNLLLLKGVLNPTQPPRNPIGYK